MIFTAHDLTGKIGKATVNTKLTLGRGATAIVYQATFQGEIFAAKIYHQDRAIDKVKIEAMLANVPSNMRIQVAGERHPQFAWPLAWLSDSSGRPAGYLMPLLDLAKAFPLDYYYDQSLIKKLKSPAEAALSFKLEIARNLAKLVADLHEHGHYFIDMKPQNIRVLLDSHVVTLVDCDGFSIAGSGGRRHPAELLSSDYIAPEAQRRNSSPADLAEPQDRYALAVILFQLLNRGTHPFQGIVTAAAIKVSTNDEKAAAGLYPHGLVSDTRIKPRPQSTHHLWPDETRALFDQAFTTGSPSARPSAQEWADHFKSLLDKKVLVRCDRMPDNLEHIRFRGKGCPACYLSALPTLRPQTRPETPRVQPAPTPSAPVPAQGNNNGWWIAGGIAGLLLMILSNSNDRPSTTRQETPSVAIAPPRSTTAPAPDIAVEPRPTQTAPPPLGTIEEKPPRGSGHTLTENQLRYCWSESKRLEYLREFISPEDVAAIAKETVAVDDFNGRCVNQNVVSEALSQAVKAQVAGKVVALKQQAQTRAGQWRRQARATDENATSQTHSKPFDVNKQY